MEGHATPTQVAPQAAAGADDGRASLLIVTDAWRPQINGVVRCLESLTSVLRARGYRVELLTPEPFFGFPLPTYPDIRLALPPLGTMHRTISSLAPDHVHIATEGPLGLAARHYCLTHGIAFTTSFHTRYAEYVTARLAVPAALPYAFLRWFHAPAAATLVPTPSIRAELEALGFSNLVTWTRGVDHKRFSPGPRRTVTNQTGPVMLYVGRVAVEKNIRALLDLTSAGTKVVVGDGPQMAELHAAYPDVHFAGMLHGEELVDAYRGADVFVFPSRTDTFGNVMLEAMSCGVPVAAYPVTGPVDVVAQGRSGYLSDDLGAAIQAALRIDRRAPRRHALSFSWERCADIFADTIVPAQPGLGAAA